MIERTLKTTNGKLKVSIPETIDEITLGQLMAMQEKEHLDDLDAISILSGIPKIQLYNVNNFDDFRSFGEQILMLSYQISYLYKGDKMPKKVLFKLNDRDISIDVMHNLSVEPAGAFMAARDIIVDEISAHIDKYGEENWQELFQPSLKACCQVLAHYFYCRATGKKYDEYAAEEFIEEIKKLRVTEALPISRHFFTCYPCLSKPRISFFQQMRQFWRRKRELRNLKSLNTSIQ